MGRFEEISGIILIINERVFGKICACPINKANNFRDDNTHKRVKIKSVSRMYKFDGFFDALDCMLALRNQAVKPIECRLYAAKCHCYIMMKTDLKQRIFVDKTALEFGERIPFRTYPIIAERAALISADFYSDSAKIGG